MIDLKQRWSQFVSIILDPWLIILLLVAVFLAFVLVGQKDTLVVTSLILIVSIISGVVGGILSNRWNELSEEKVIHARGKTAVRSLKLLLGNIFALDNRVCEYLARHDDESLSETVTPEVVKTYLEEVIGRCGVLEEEALSSIENWTDIVPEADIKTQIGVITDLRTKVAQAEAELLQLQGEVDDQARDKNLEEEISQKERELTRLRQEIASARQNLSMFTAGSGVVFGGSGGGVFGGSPDIVINECPDCKRLFSGSDIRSCPHCGGLDIRRINLKTT